MGATWALRTGHDWSVTETYGLESPSENPLNHWAILENPWCRRRDLNPHDPKVTSPSSWRVCHFATSTWVSSLADR